MECMFWDAENLNQPIDTWDVSQVIEMKGMFKGASFFNQCLSTWAEKTPNDVDTELILTDNNCPDGYAVSPNTRKREI
jgi:surface protein